MLSERAGWGRFPDDVREWLEVQDYRRRLPAPGELLVESFPHGGRHYTTYYTFEGWNANQSLGMLITRRMEDRGLLPGGFVANDYCLAVWGLKPVTDPAPLLSPDILTHEFVDWVTESHLLRRAFREVAVISGLVERQHPGRKKTGKQVTFSTDLIYDVLRKYEPDHVLLEAAWADARARMTDVGRLADLLERSERELAHVELDRVSPLAVPVMTMIGREAVLSKRQAGLSRRLLQFRLREPEPLLYHNEPVIRDGEIVGYLTSGNYGHHLGAAIGLGWLIAVPVVVGWPGWSDASAWPSPGVRMGRTGLVAAVFVVFAWFVLRAARARRLGLATFAGLAGIAVSHAFVPPLLLAPHRELWVTERVVQTLERAGWTPGEPVAAVGYHEDSLMFAARGRLERLPGNAAPDHSAVNARFLVAPAIRPAPAWP